MPDELTLPPRDPTATIDHTPPADPPATDPTAVPVVQGYEIAGELGRGGMGVVYRARQIGLNRTVALKMILAGGHAGAADLSRFRAEAESVARLQHPNVVQVHEVGESGGLPYFSLEFCPGGSLAAKLDGTPWEPRRAAELVEAVARAVQAAHDRQIVHRDLKPANILLAADGTPKVADFGLAKQLDAAGNTASGAVLGTPSYMAPEQANGSKNVGPAADIYALGATLYELLTGRPPFKAPTALDTMMQVVSDEPARPRSLQSKTPADLEAVCLRCLEKSPANRYASTAALADDLKAWAGGRPVAARPLGFTGRTVRWAKSHRVLAATLAVLTPFSVGMYAILAHLFGPAEEVALVGGVTPLAVAIMLLLNSFALDRKERAVRLAQSRIADAAGALPAALTEHYIAKKSLIRWMNVCGWPTGLGYMCWEVATSERWHETAQPWMAVLWFLAGTGIGAALASTNLRRIA